MYALSRDGEKVYLHQPDAGMAVPVLLDLEHMKLSVRAPSVAELEDDYAVYDDLNDVLRVVGRDNREKVNFARKFSRECSKVFREQMSAGKLTISQLRALIEDLMRSAAVQPAKAAIRTSGA